LPCLALHVVDHVRVLYVSIEAKNCHKQKIVINRKLSSGGEKRIATVTLYRCQKNIYRALIRNH
jgi:hypothetical protein